MLDLDNSTGLLKVFSFISHVNGDINMDAQYLLDQ